MKSWYKSMTMQGLGAILVGFALSFVGIDAGESAALVDRILASADEIMLIGGTLIAAWGRKRASGPLTG